jgi:hypothetical protein
MSSDSEYPSKIRNLLEDLRVMKEKYRELDDKYKKEEKNNRV